MRQPTGLVLLAIAALLPACDSSSFYTADLGQRGNPPSLQGAVLPLQAGAQVEEISFTPPKGGAFPADWLSAQSAKVQIGSALLPVASTSLGGTSSFVASVPLTLGFAPPISSNPTPMAFEIDATHMMVAEVTF